MSTINVYTSAPTSTQLACALLNLESLGLQVTVRSLAELPAPADSPRPRCLSVLSDELHDVTQSLVLLGEQLGDHETGRCRLDASTEQGLRFDRDTLQSHQRALRAAIRVQEGGQGNG